MNSENDADSESSCNNINIDTNGVSKYSDSYFSMSYKQIKKLYCCKECKKIFTRDMIFGEYRSEVFCYHCVMKDAEDSDIFLIKDYINKCYSDHNSKDCENDRCVLCRYAKGDIIIHSDVSKITIRL